MNREKEKNEKTQLPGDYSAFLIDWYRLLCAIGQISLSLTPQSLKASGLVNLDPQNDGPKTKKWHEIVTVRRRAARGADDQRSSNMVIRAEHSLKVCL